MDWIHNVAKSCDERFYVLETSSRLSLYYCSHCETHNDEVNVQRERTHSHSKCHDVTHNYSRHSTATYIHYRSRPTLPPFSFSLLAVLLTVYSFSLVTWLPTGGKSEQHQQQKNGASRKVIRNSCRVRAIFHAIISYGIRLHTLVVEDGDERRQKEKRLWTVVDSCLPNRISNSSHKRRELPK